MCFATLLPLGFIQLYESVDAGYYHARSLDFLTNSTNTADRVAAVPRRRPVHRRRRAAAALHLLVGVRHRVERETLEEPEDILFTDVTEPGRGSGG